MARHAESSSVAAVRHTPETAMPATTVATSVATTVRRPVVKRRPSKKALGGAEPNVVTRRRRLPRSHDQSLHLLQAQRRTLERKAAKRLRRERRSRTPSTPRTASTFRRRSKNGGRCRNHREMRSPGPGGMPVLNCLFREQSPKPQRNRHKTWLMMMMFGKGPHLFFVCLFGKVGQSLEMNTGPVWPRHVRKSVSLG